MTKTKSIFVITAITLVLLIALESSARVYIGWQRGNASVGLSERTQNLNYEPFTMWGKNLDLESEKFIKNLPTSTFKILLLGASTAEGFDVRLLRDAFTKSINKKVVVFNAASGGFNARQEAISLVLIAEKIKPNLILVLDGANDVIHSTRPGVVVGTTYVDSTYRTILERPFLAPLIYLMQNSQLYNGLLSKFRRNGFQSFYSAKQTTKAISIYLETRDFINHYANGTQTPIVFVLQPFVGFSLSEGDSNAKSIYSYREPAIVKGFEMISKTINSRICFIDSNVGLRKNRLKLSFSDDVHFKDLTGYRYLTGLFLAGYKKCYGTL